MASAPVCEFCVKFCELHEIFQRAADYVAKISDHLASHDLLFLYARYKQVTCGPCNTAKPSILNWKAKQKWEAWNSLSVMSHSQAMKEYVDKVSEIHPYWQEQHVKTNSINTPLGLKVSTLQRGDDDDVADGEKTAYDWCKEGNVDMVRQTVGEGISFVNEPDDNGMCLIHWAADRGHAHIVSLLISLRANVDQQDKDGQTALHYAVSCEHFSVIETLIQHGASPYIADDDGLLATSLTQNPRILALFQSPRAS